ncbi:hypothetical protein E2P81_ATG05575 [Venturia nashicola]|nr:hypothetical protein E2P81_ATG05575 [Venturia nashicola]
MLHPKTTDFAVCRETYLGTWPQYRNYSWSGPVRNIQPNPRQQISYEGCKALCGTGNDRYPWSETAQTLSTWLLPVLGMLLQAPFISNQFWNTLLVLARWLGSPMSSLACILWNISASGKCAMMVDMAVGYDSPPIRGELDLDNQLVDFRSMRDSFYILVTMNQYSIKTTHTSKSEAQGLLRIALFSKNLELEGTDKTIRETRQELARMLRRHRRRNAVPIFISTMWFLFSLGISIQAAFEKLGENTTAHELAMGLALSWLPILILCSIVDCVSVSASEMRDEINALVDLVSRSLQNSEIRGRFIDTFRYRPEYHTVKDRVTKISSQSHKLQGGFFTSFAGQGRVRWHYGVAHPLLSEIENCHIADHGRNWLADEEQARISLVLGSPGRGLFWFDFRQLWQVCSATLVVGGCCLGGFIVSFFTPTVGLGCRSLGFLVYFLVSLFLVFLEFLIWRLTSFSPEDREEERLRQERFGCLKTPPSRKSTMDSLFLKETSSWVTSQRARVENALIRVVSAALAVFHSSKHRQAKRDELRRTLVASIRAWHDLRAREQMHYLVFVPLEFTNAAILIYILLAQSFGLYVNCRCKSASFGPGGGYIDLIQTNRARNPITRASWITGTSISCVIMTLGACYIVLEWCLQSHLGTEHQGRARRGLARVRVFRRMVYWIRYPFVCCVLFVNGLQDCLFRNRSNAQKTLRWTRHETYRKPIKLSSLTWNSSVSTDLDTKESLKSYGTGKTVVCTDCVSDKHDEQDIALSRSSSTEDVPEAYSE